MSCGIEDEYLIMCGEIEDEYLIMCGEIWVVV